MSNIQSLVELISSYLNLQRTKHKEECKTSEQEQQRALTDLRQNLTKLQDERRFGQTRRQVLSGEIAVLEQRIASAKSVFPLSLFLCCGCVQAKPGFKIVSVVQDAYGLEEGLCFFSLHSFFSQVIACIRCPNMFSRYIHSLNFMPLFGIHDSNGKERHMAYAVAVILFCYGQLLSWRRSSGFFRQPLERLGEAQHPEGGMDAQCSCAFLFRCAAFF
jgi:hypothetical protein